MSRSGADIRASETQSKVLQDRISAIEKHLGSLCDTFGSYTRKTARLRDKGDLLCKELVEYGDYEKWNPTLRKGLNQFAESLSAIQDYREAQVNRLERKVVFHLSQYGQLCKLTKIDLKGSFSTQQKESQQKKKLEQIRTKTPQNRQQIAEKELNKASVDASRSQLAVEQQMETFERKKIQDMRNILREFANIELLFHAKALELYTECFKSLEDIDPEADLDEYHKQTQPSSTSRTTLARSASQQSLVSQPDSQGNAPRPQHGQAPSSRMRTEDMDDDDEEEEDDEDDDDDDDDDDDYTEGESTARSSNIASKSKKQ